MLRSGDDPAVYPSQMPEAPTLIGVDKAEKNQVAQKYTLVRIEAVEQSVPIQVLPVGA